MADFKPNSGSLLNEPRTSSGLSTQIIIRIGDNPVGAIQELTVSQDRPLVRVQEVGTDGIIEIVPNGGTTIDLSVSRIVFDQLRLPESFSRAFRFIQSQVIAFDIDVYDISRVTPNSDVASQSQGITVMTYKNCWFKSYKTPYRASDYLITEDATLWAETAFISNPQQSNGDGFPAANPLGFKTSTDSTGIESSVNYGGRRGSMDASGLWNTLFDGTTGS